MNTFRFSISDHMLILYAIGVALVWTGLIIIGALYAPKGDIWVGVITVVGCLGIGLSTRALLIGMSPLCEFTLDERGFRQKFLSKTFGIQRQDRFIPWNELAGYSTLTDGAGDVLTLRLREGKTITFTHSKYLPGQEVYTQFIARLEQLIAAQPVRPEEAASPIREDPNMYGSPGMRVFGGLIALSLLAVPGGLYFTGQPISSLLTWRIAFMYLVGLPLVYRVFVARR